MDYTSYGDEGLGFSKYLSKCFLWMFLGLILTFVTAAGFSFTGLLADLLLSFGTGFIILFAVIEVVLVIALSASLSKLSSGAALSMFMIYSVVNGITLSSIFYIYDLTSIVYVFLGSAAVFGIMALVGYKTNLNLSRLGSFITISLLLSILFGIIMMFAFNETAYLIYNVLGIGLFMIITTYDMHVIKHMYYESGSDSHREVIAIFGALQLYLDFINVFLRLLALFGKSRD